MNSPVTLAESSNRFSRKARKEPSRNTNYQPVRVSRTMKMAEQVNFQIARSIKGHPRKKEK